MKQTGRTGTVMGLLRAMKPYAPEAALTTVFVAIRHLTVFALAITVARMVSLALLGSLGPVLPGLMLRLCLLIGARALCYYCDMLFGHDTAYQIQRDTRIGIYRQLDALAPAYINRRSTHQIGATVMGDIELLEWFVAHTFGSLIAGVGVTLWLMWYVSRFHWTLSLMTGVFALAIGISPHLLHRLADRQGAEVRQRNAEANAAVMEGIQGLQDILAFQYMEGCRKKIRGAFRKLYEADLGYCRRSGLEGAAEQLLAGGFCVLVLILGAALAEKQVLTPESLPLVLMLAYFAFHPIREANGACRDLGILFGAADRIQEIFRAEPEVRDTGATVDPGTLVPQVDFSHVTFGYDRGQPPVIRNVSFHAEPGATVALVGPSGAGKTTCINLLLRYWDSWEGSIQIGGRDIRDLSLETLRNLTSAVLQDVFLFHTTVRENIRLGRPDATDQEVEEAAKKAYAHDFILGLPEGYDTVTGERGFRLSGGQRQRISIARAILRDAPILILDEAVCSLDTENERLIQAALDAHAKGRTTIVIAHRLSTIRNADHLVVIRQGRVVQTGTHGELLHKQGFYQQLMEHQLDLHQDA